MTPWEDAMSSRPVSGSSVKDSDPVARSGGRQLRSIMTAPADPDTVAETASWTLRPEVLLPAVYVASAFPLASAWR